MVRMDLTLSTSPQIKININKVNAPYKDGEHEVF